MPLTYSTEVELGQTRSLLAQFEPDLLRRLDRRLTRAARSVKAGAQSRFEATGATGTAFRVRTRTRKGKRIVSVTTTPGSVSPGERWSSSPGVLAAIFELAAGVRDAKPQNVKRTQNLIATLNAKYGAPGRFAWDSWDEHKDVTLRDVAAAIAETEREYSARMKGA